MKTLRAPRYEPYERSGIERLEKPKVGIFRKAFLKACDLMVESRFQSAWLRYGPLSSKSGEYEKFIEIHDRKATYAILQAARIREIAGDRLRELELYQGAVKEYSDASAALEMFPSEKCIVLEKYADCRYKIHEQVRGRDPLMGHLLESISALEESLKLREDLIRCWTSGKKSIGENKLFYNIYVPIVLKLSCRKAERASVLSRSEHPADRVDAGCAYSSAAETCEKALAFAAEIKIPESEFLQRLQGRAEELRGKAAAVGSEGKQRVER